MTLHTGRYRVSALAALVFFFCSCGRSDVDYVISPDKGLVMASLSSDIIVKSSDVFAAEDFSDYNFRYVGDNHYYESDDDWYRFGDVSWPMEWYFGTFRLQAESCTEEEADAGYGILRYEGVSQPFTVINGQMASASVICTVANVRVNVSFDDRMFLSFKNFKLDVESVRAPVYEEDEEGNKTLVSEEQSVRSLEFDAINKSGFYSISDDPMWLKYTLYVMMYDAEEFIESKSGYFINGNPSEPAFIKRGDYITFKVSYVGEVETTADIKFKIEAEMQTMSNGFTIEDYTQDSVREDD